MIKMNFSFRQSVQGGALLLLLALQSSAAKADENKSKPQSLRKKQSMTGFLKTRRLKLRTANL